MLEYAETLARKGEALAIRLHDLRLQLAKQLEVGSDKDLVRPHNLRMDDGTFGRVAKAPILRRYDCSC